MMSVRLLRVAQRRVLYCRVCTRESRAVTCTASASRYSVDDDRHRCKSSCDQQAHLCYARARELLTLSDDGNVELFPMKKGAVKYDPSKSEAYKALQEESLGDVIQEVKQPARTGVFSPHKANHSKIHQPASKNSGASYVNSLNDSSETIHQSNSFKRIMYSVLGQTDY